MSGVMMAFAVPPAAGTRHNPPWPREKMIVLSLPQLAPYGSVVSQIIVASPLPSIGIFLSAPALQNPNQRPSGDVNGTAPPTVPGNAVASSRSIVRTYNCCRSPSAALKMIDRPSGDQVMAVRLGRPSLTLRSSGDACSRSAGATLTRNRVTRASTAEEGAPRRPIQKATAMATIAASDAIARRRPLDRTVDGGRVAAAVASGAAFRA